MFQAVEDMYQKCPQTPNNEFCRAYNEDKETFDKYLKSDVYKSWVDKNPTQEFELQFQALAKHFCGHKYKGFLAHTQYSDFQFI